MLKLKRGSNLYVDHQRENRLFIGDSNKLSLAHTPLTLWITLSGACDRESGFVVNVVEIDRVIGCALRETPFKADQPIDIFKWTRKELADRLGGYVLSELTMDLNESISIGWGSQNPNMIQVTRKYEFAASHQLLNPDWDEAQNLQVFGKCHNPQGHGHNYTLELTLEGVPDSETGQVADLDAVDRLVDELIIERFDHKHLNKQTQEFAKVNPTVENMVQVFWELLAGRFDKARLVKIGVWETPRTYAEYSGPVS